METMIDYGDDRVRFVGTIDVEIAEVPLAIEMTRAQNAVLIGPASVETQAEVLDEIVARLTSATPTEFSLLNFLIQRVPNDEIFLGRGFGAFDDVEVGVDVFGDSELLDRIELALSKDS